MMARSRPRARIAALKAAARFAPEPVMITIQTAATPIPTAAGCVRRQCSETSAVTPSTIDRRPLGDARRRRAAPARPAADAGLERLFFDLTTPPAAAPSHDTDLIHAELAGATA